ncbi:MAG TPA: hypothetical protein DEF51_08050, partial [Myxococcales bacterium]|nr:hypothetical protein [Myxococcales bacterium]
MTRPRASSRSLRVLFLTEGRDVPASRFRAEQFFPFFEREGVRCTLVGAYGKLYNRLHTTPLGGPYKLLTRAARAASGLRAARYDLVFSQRPALPQSPLPERLLARLQPRIVFDFDDAIWLGPGGTPSAARERTFRHVVGCARWVVAGNGYLARRAAAPEKTTVLPTVVDMDATTPPLKPRGPRAPVVGWMGTAGNLPFLEAVMPDVLRAVADTPGARVRIVSNARSRRYESHPSVEQVGWSRDREVDLLRSFDVGLMPLPDDELTRGKCGFKMIQYMAVGAAVVASAVGANPELFAGSGAGELVPPG